MASDSARLTDDALAELARLAGEATPGPWVAGGGGYIGYAVEDAKGEVIVYDEGSPSDADAAYIAAADPSTVAALVAEAKRLRAAVRWAMGGERGRATFPGARRTPRRRGAVLVAEGTAVPRRPGRCLVSANLVRLGGAGYYVVIGGPTRSRGEWLWWCNAHPQGDHSGQHVTHATGATPDEAVAAVCAALLPDDA